MSSDTPRIMGFEIYFERLQAAKEFYRDVLGSPLTEHVPAHHAKFDGLQAFLCLERKGVETYPSADKAVVFIEVADLGAMLGKLGDRILESVSRTTGGPPTWAVLHDPEGHNVILIQAASKPR
ncbi:MAG TPA: VOC family protein [Terriglobales bacterium]|nr:VOC family protein [Terriglobales bacterium]